MSHAKGAEVEIIVAINKIDKEQANPDRVMTQLSEYELVPTQWGGKTEFIPVSARTGQGVQDLLETILLVAELLELKANPGKQATGAVIEAEMDRNRGPIATVLIQNGTLNAGITYYKARGLEPAGHLRMDPGPTWREVPPGELYPRGFGFEQDVQSLYEQIRAACTPSADGVFVGGTGFRCVALIEALEKELGRPVVTANQASLWRCLQHAGIQDPISGYGALLRSSR